MSHIMLDLETLGLYGTPPIVQIGAVEFVDGEILSEFDLTVSAEYQAGVELRTLAWWESRGGYPVGDRHVHDALSDFAVWIGHKGQDGMWSKGPDWTWLGNAWWRLGGNRPPWPYRYVRCLRTLMAMNGAEGEAESLSANATHSAIEDARAQARVAMALLW